MMGETFFATPGCTEPHLCLNELFNKKKWQCNKYLKYIGYASNKIKLMEMQLTLQINWKCKKYEETIENVRNINKILKMQEILTKY